ncbi:MLP-like protein [Quillaja saponaria]|uniref:MLP-like protein n=1 Tax=Quillaja saponaria TaxID=32244 RepID=A0AAD7LBB5_QUISA|nr:MLP-like protein [Quillaja saponaria]
MTLNGKLESEMEINMPTAKFYNIWKNETHHVSTATPDRIQAVDVHEEGNAEVFKEKLEFDDETKSVSLVGLEGDVMKVYKVFKPTYQCIPKGEGGCLLKMTLEYERPSEDIPPPVKYKSFMVELAKDVEAHHLKA